MPTPIEPTATLVGVPFLTPKQPDTGSLAMDLTSLEVKLTKSEVWQFEYSDNTATNEMVQSYVNATIGLYPVGELIPVFTTGGYIMYLYCQRKTAKRSTTSSNVFHLTVEYASPPIILASSGKKIGRAHV